MPLSLFEGAAGEQGESAGAVAVEEQAQGGQQHEQSGETAPNTDASADAAFFERLRNTDPEKLPAELRAKLELPFLQQSSRKATESNQRQTQLLEGILGQLQRAGAAPTTPDEKAALVERIKNGEFDAIGDLVSTSINQTVNPIVNQLLQDRAFAAAEKVHPYAKEREREIAQVIQNDPMARELAGAAGFRYFPAVVRAIALDMEATELRAQLKAANEKNATLEKSRNASLPATTTRAGSTPSAGASGKGAATLREAMRDAARIAGLPMPEHE